MRLLKRISVMTMALGVMALAPTRADAALLTINDGADVWTLTVQDGCTTCAVTLSVTYTNSSARLGDFLQGVQWDLTDPSVQPTDIGFTSTTAGTTSDWAFDLGVVSNGGCNTNSTGAVCGQWQGSGTGFPVSVGTFSWSFNSTFASQLANLVSGNIRAAYDVDPDGDGPLGKIFSPDGGTFGGGGSGGGGSTIPEPASMLLFGVGALAAAKRARRRFVA
jgi:hypothetical protein